VKRTVKVVLVCLALVCLATTSVSAAGKGKGSLRLGLEFGEPLAVIIIRPAPFDFKIGYDFADNGWLFLSADYRIVSGFQLIDFLHLFLSAGVYTQIYFDRDDPVDFGLRVPVGLQVFLINNVLEIFLEVAPTIGFVPRIEAFPSWQGYIGFTVLIPKFWK
jgi:hypothetical protein